MARPPKHPNTRSGGISGVTGCLNAPEIPGPDLLSKEIGVSGVDPRAEGRSPPPADSRLPRQPPDRTRGKTCGESPERSFRPPAAGVITRGPLVDKEGAGRTSLRLGDDAPKADSTGTRCAHESEAPTVHRVPFDSTFIADFFAGRRQRLALDAGRARGIATAKAAAAPLKASVRDELNIDLMLSYGPRGRAGRIARRLLRAGSKVSARHVQRILDTLSSES